MSYSRKEIASGFITEIAMRLSQAGLITEEQLVKIRADFKSRLYTPSVFVRIGLFIFTLILVNAVLGIIGMTIADLINNQTAIGVLLIIVSACVVAGLEYYIHQKYHYRSGIDDCLLYIAIVFLVTGIVLVSGISDPLQICLIPLPVLLLASWRYADSVASFFALVCFYTALFLVLKDYSWGRVWMPFIYFGVSGVLVYLFNHQLRKEENFYYERSLQVLKVAALLALYGSMNYFVVKEGNRLLNENSLALQTAEIPFAWLFLAITFILPVVYIFKGVHSKDRLLIWTGLAVLIFSLLTLKYRFDFLRYEYLMTWSGLIILLGSWAAIRYLKQNSLQYTFAPDSSQSNAALLDAEALLVSQTLGQQAAEASPGHRFGGGSFGGGGAGGNL